MALTFLDMTSTLLQSITFTYMVYYCTNRKEGAKYISSLAIIPFIMVTFPFVTGIYGNNTTSGVLLSHILLFGLVSIFNRKNIVKALTAFTIIYSIMDMYTIIFGSLIFEYVKHSIPIQYINYEIIFIIYIPSFILLVLCFKYREKIRLINDLIVNEDFWKIIIIMSFLLDFMVTFYLVELGEKSQLLKNIIDIIFFIFLIVIVIYFGNIHRKSKEILKLNNSLEIKNNELRKIKHDYGAQISYLYGLCLMERFGDLKKALKDIINNNENTLSAIEIDENNNSLLALALKPALKNGIHVIIKGDGDIGLCKMPEIELYRIISNIVNNAIKAMNGEGIIIAKVQTQLEYLIIKIENNGPKIKEEYIEKIFESGFTTKDNIDKSHGFGLSIVKDLIENYNGKISLKSTDISTEFKIILPIK